MPPQRRRLVLAACMAASFMAAVEATIVATAMPTIVADLGGFALFGWVFSAYLLTQAVTIPIYGRLADLFGRKRVFYVGAAIFLLGSTLSGFAPSMLALVIFRTLQGTGAGAIIPVTQTIIGDIYAPAERAKMQGWISSVWGISAVAGPVLGAFIVSHLGWPLIFWVNLPVGAIAVAMLAVFLREHPQTRRREIDFIGTGLLVLGATALMLALLQADSLGWWVAPLLVLALLSLVALVWQEKRAPEPLLPPALWRNPTIVTGNLGGLAIGAVMMGVSAFLPTYVQGVLGRSTLDAGIVIAAMSLAWPIASTTAGRLMLVTSYRTTALIGAAALLLGSLVLLTLTPVRGVLVAGVGAALIGTGLGMCSTTFLVSVQNAAGWSMRGIATSSTVFMRQFGAALGTAVLGAVLNIGLATRLRGADAPMQTLMDPQRRAALPADQAQHLAVSVAACLHDVYGVTVAIAVVALLVAWLTPSGLRPGHVAEPAGE
jgi:EmrB/QacA subfamily drug resistance transporter